MTTWLLFALIVAFLAIIAAICMCFEKKQESGKPRSQEIEQEDGHVESLLNMLCDYKTIAETGLSQDIEKALLELNRVAENNHTGAQDFLSSIYRDALNTADNNIMGESAQDIRQKAFYWNTRSAERGQADAQFCLATMYLEGLGVDKDEKRAIDLLTQAAENNHKKATLLLGSIYYKAVTKAAGNNSNSISKQSWEDTQQKAFYWVNKAAESGYLEASATLGTMYFDQGDKDKAIFWFEKAANRNHATSMFFLGMIYMEKMQLDKADIFFAKAAELGCKSSKDLLQKSVK